MTPARRFIVRTSLVTGSTIATIVGAQSLALLDLQANTQADSITDPTQAVIAPTTNTVDTPAIITDSAPSIAIIRRPASQTSASAPAVSTNSSSGSTSTTVTQTNPTTSNIVPPSPVQSQPVTVSMPQQPTSRSSR